MKKVAKKINRGWKISCKQLFSTVSIQTRAYGAQTVDGLAALLQLFPGEVSHRRTLRNGPE